MKVLYCCIFFTIFTLCDAYSQEYWIRHPSPTTKWLRSCIFTDTLNGWAVGDSGAIIHTSNAGQSWILQNSGIDYQITYVIFVNNRLGWCIANDYLFHGTTILKTTNGGTNWAYSLYPDTTIILKTICFIDSLNGYMGGQNGTILKSTNAGVNWQKNVIDTGIYSDRMIYKFSFYNSQFGFACGGIFDADGVIWKTTDFGMHWISQYVSPEPVFDLVIIDSSRAVGSGGDYEFGAEIVKTNNSGNTWRYSPLQMFGIGYSIAARTKYDLWVALGFGSYWEHSIDTGNTFQPIPIPDTSGINDVKFIDSLHGWAVGSNSSIYKFNAEIIGIKPIRNEIPSVYQLYQNYPNPFNPITKIKYNIPVNSYVRLSIYDLLGKEVSVLVDSKQSPGTYEVNFDGTNFATGLYFYEIKTVDFVKVKKMVLIK